MAEAHQAVAFSFQITHEGWDVNFDREVLNLVWQSGVRSWKKRFARFMNSVHNGVYPAHLWTLWITMSIVVAIHFSGFKLPYDLVTRIMPFLPGSSIKWQLFGSAVVGTLMWLTVIYMIRYSLKLLLMYKGWMYEQRGKGARISTRTKLWVIFVRILSGWNKPKLYSFQGSLPKLPLPSLHDTMRRYLKSVRPLLDADNYDKMAKLAEEFEKGIGVKLQRYLILKSWWSSNYVSDWWEEYVYLRGRSPLMINSNFYGIDAIFMKPTDKQAARAAAVIHSFLTYRRLVERQELEPILAQNCVPLCSWQYERIFNTTRIPGVETDKIVHWSDSNHIVVYHKGRYFKVVIYRRRILKPREIQVQIQQILDDTSEPQPGEEKLAALTASNRTEWANVRRNLFNKGTNKTSLDTIEKAAFVVALDDFPYIYDPKDPSQLDKYGKNFLHGKGYDRWFDKSFTLCIGSNGKVGFNAEHSWADAAVMSHIWECVIYDDTTIDRADAAVLTHMWEYFIIDESTNRRVRRLRYRRLRDVSNPFAMPEENFIKMYRLPIQVVQDILIPQIENHIQVGVRASYVPIHLRVLATLHLLAQGNYQASIGSDNVIALSQSTVSKIVTEVIEIIAIQIFNQYIKFPTLGNEVNIVMQGYDSNGDVKGECEMVPPTPTRLQWEIKADGQLQIETAAVNAQKLIDDLDLRIYVHDNYGKGFMKKCRISPDAYIQMALQLAYYRDAGKFCLTYEASMTRLFREGRTETVRPCSIESSAWVRAMEDKNFAKDEKIKLLRLACDNHQKSYQDAMCGKGIDRHLFCLYVVARYLEVDSPFLQKVLSEPWRLSTSQTPHGQTGRMDLNKHPDCISAGGGFGPVADDGYGVSYIIAGENLLFFHISNKKSCNETDCHRFASRIEQALQDIKNLFTTDKDQINGIK